jgi:hypothetical protein
MTTTNPDPIRVQARVIRGGELNSYGEQTWEIDCPHCGEVHTHGGREGRRMANCTELNPAYLLVAPEE